MPDKPAAEIVIDEGLVRRLVVTQAADAVVDAASLRLTKVAEGWDSELWRLGPDLAVRLPRRALAAPLVEHEQRVLPEIAARVEPASGLRLPVPLVDGRPADGFPWPWSVVPWIDGAHGLDIPRDQRVTWAAPLAAALRALHVPAPVDHPINPARGVPLALRAAAVDARFTAQRGRTADALLDSARRRWDAALAAPAWAGPPVWIHGDLHPGNLIARRTGLVGIIDFGDVTAGDPAYDLAIAWLAFDSVGRAAFIAATHDRYDTATWTRAHGWAAATAILLLGHSDDNPEYAALGAAAAAELASDQAARRSSRRAM